jgi:FAD/FMN-containing dehydrogenase
MEISGWGRYPRHRTRLLAPDDPRTAQNLLTGRTGLVSRGNGRAYGDAAIGQAVTAVTKGLDRMRAFDPATGRLTVEAGVLLADILERFVPRGFFPPVVPGTKFVTVGGMIASDVHGKNHHRDGGFGAHVQSLSILLPGGETVVCAPDRQRELLDATIGGMGLTGTILDATFDLRRIETGWMRQRTLVAHNLDEAIAALAETSEASYSVAWIDCLARGPKLGRSLIFAAEHATAADLAEMRPGAPTFPDARAERLGVPIDLPGFALNRVSVAAFNELYFRAGASKAGAPFLVPWDPYFFPLDSIRDWGRIYGRNGFLQHQSVIPPERAKAVLTAMIERLSRSGGASFLAVLKQLGGGTGLMSFPLEGYTLALDLQVSDRIFLLLDDIDRLVVEAGGRLYLAKDARQSRETFEAGYPELSRFRDIRRAIGAETRIASQLSTRLGI